MHDSQKPLFMSVNVSGRQMEDASFFKPLETGLEVTGVSPSSVKLEITESALTDPGIARVDQTSEGDRSSSQLG